MFESPRNESRCRRRLRLVDQVDPLYCRYHRLARHLRPTQPVASCFPLTGKRSINTPCGRLQTSGMLPRGILAQRAQHNYGTSPSPDLDIYSSLTSGIDIRDMCTRPCKARPRRKTHRISGVLPTEIVALPARSDRPTSFRVPRPFDRVLKVWGLRQFFE